MFGYSRSRPRAAARRKPAQTRSRDTVAAILEAAAHVLARRGYAGFTTNHVASRAGVSIGSIYQYFPDKDALLGALAERDVQRACSAMLSALERLHDAALAEPIWAQTLLRAWCESHDQAHQFALYTISLALPGVRARAEAEAHALVAAVAKKLRAAGVGRPALRARVLLLIGGSLVHELVIALPHGAERQRAEREAAAAMTAYLRSVLP